MMELESVKMLTLFWVLAFKNTSPQQNSMTHSDFFCLFVCFVGQYSGTIQYGITVRNNTIIVIIYKLHTN